MKSLEVSEEKANQRVEEFKRQLKSLTLKLKEAENRAELAEKTVKKLQKEVDRLEGMFLEQCQLEKKSFCSLLFLFAITNFFSPPSTFDSKSKQRRKEILSKKSLRQKKNLRKIISVSRNIFFIFLSFPFKYANKKTSQADDLFLFFI